jgi:hypothetical protein
MLINQYNYLNFSEYMKKVSLIRLENSAETKPTPNPSPEGNWAVSGIS